MQYNAMQCNVIRLELGSDNVLRLQFSKKKRVSVTVRRRVLGLK